jgi:DHA1 family multidrug resistance protein-like MFS transporter/DHA1 family quinolone resistance protein-like MFS transporter
VKTALHPARRFLVRFGRPHVILPVSFLNSIAFTTVALGVVFYLRDEFGATAGTIGIASALYSLLYFAGCFLFRPLTRRMLPRYSLLVSSVLGCAGVLSLQILTSAVAVTIVYGLLGLTVALFWPPIMGWLSVGADGQVLNRQISHFNLAWSAGSIVGPLAAGLLAQTDVRLPFLAAGALLFANAVMITVVSVFFPTIRADRYLEARRGTPVAQDASTPLRYPAWVSVIAAYTVLGAILVIVPIYGRDALGLTEGGVGLAFLVRGLATSVTFLVVGAMSWWHFRPAVLPVPVVGFALVAVGLAFAKSIGLYGILVAFAGVFAAVAYTSSVFHSAAGSPDRTRRMAVHEAVLTGGSVLGAAAGGWFYQTGGIARALSFCVIVCIVVIAVQGGLAAARRSQPRLQIRG